MAQKIGTFLFSFAFFVLKLQIAITITTKSILVEHKSILIGVYEVQINSGVEN